MVKFQIRSTRLITTQIGGELVVSVVYNGTTEYKVDSTRPIAVDQHVPLQGGLEIKCTVAEVLQLLELLPMDLDVRNEEFEVFRVKHSDLPVHASDRTVLIQCAQREMHDVCRHLREGRLRTPPTWFLAIRRAEDQCRSVPSSGGMPVLC